MPNFCVTLEQLRQAGACVKGYNKLVCHLKGVPFVKKEKHIRFKHDALINISTIVESNGMDDAYWSLQCVKDCDRDIRLYAIWCAKQVEHLMQSERSKEALRVAEAFANGNATEGQLDAARDAAWYAARDAARDAARAAAWAAAWAAARDAARDAAWYAARDAARDAARAAAWYAARDAAWYAARDAAWYAARDAAWTAAWDAAWAAQKEMFIKMCNNQAPWQEPQ